MVYDYYSPEIGVNISVTIADNVDSLCMAIKQINEIHDLLIVEKDEKLLKEGGK